MWISDKRGDTVSPSGPQVRVGKMAEQVKKACAIEPRNPRPHVVGGENRLDPHVVTWSHPHTKQPSSHPQNKPSKVAHTCSPTVQDVDTEGSGD